MVVSELMNKLERYALSAQDGARPDAVTAYRRAAELVSEMLGDGDYMSGTQALIEANQREIARLAGVVAEQAVIIARLRSEHPVHSIVDSIPDQADSLRKLVDEKKNGLAF